MILFLYHICNIILYFYKFLILLIIFIIFLSISKFSHSNDDGCFSYDCLEERIINVVLITDKNFFSQEVIKKQIHENFVKINKFYYENFKIKWNILELRNFEQNKNLSNISELYSFHKKDIKQLIKLSNAEVGLVIVGNDISGLGIAGTFSNLAMVSNIDKLSIEDSSIIIAHEFGHLFGAWHTQKINDFMLYRGANSFDVSKESKAILKLMRSYNFNPESIFKKDKILKRISRIYERHHARHEINPVARLLTDKGIEYFEERNYSKAVKILNRSLSYYGRWGKTRNILSKTYFELGQFHDSFLEYTRAVFFGEKPDLIFENKLRNKFIELQKTNPDIINPFFNK